MTRSSRPSARDRLLDVADRLFYRRGVQAVGVDEVAAEAGVAKSTLYGNFGSKDELVVAYLRRRAQREREELERELSAVGGPAEARILHVFDLLARSCAEPDFRGCPFINACAELGRDHPAAAVAREHRRRLLGTFAALAGETRAAEPDVLAARLLQLHDAVTVGAQLDGGTDPARVARAVAALLPVAPSPHPTADREGDPGPAPGRADGSVEARRLVAFLNTLHLPGGDDRLTDERAGPWLATWLDAGGAGRSRADPAAEPADDLRDLRDLREGLRQLSAAACGADPDPALVTGAAATLRHRPVLVDLAGGGAPRLTATPDDAGAASAAIAAVATAYLAVRARDEWGRLKVCASPDCRWAFLDATRNRSRRWCDMSGCGNRAKNRRWRARRSPRGVTL